MTNRFKSPSTLVSFVCIALLLFLPRIVLGQVSNVADDTSTPIPGAGHDYIKMINETVNPANGSVSVRISVPVPQSRGFTLPFAFAYDSDGVLHLDGYGAGEAGTAAVATSAAMVGHIPFHSLRRSKGRTV